MDTNEEDKMDTAKNINDLRTEAASAGDMAQVKICDRALSGDTEAIEECARVIAVAAAMTPPPEIDWYQTDGEHGEKIGYIMSENGGYFFTWAESLDEIVESLDPDVMDAPDFSMSYADDEIRRRIGDSPVELRELIAEK